MLKHPQNLVFLELGNLKKATRVKSDAHANGVGGLLLRVAKVIPNTVEYASAVNCPRLYLETYFIKKQR